MGHGVRSNRGKVDPGAKEGKYLLTFVDDNGVVHEVQTEYVVLVSVASDDSETRQLILLSSIRVKTALCIVCPYDCFRGRPVRNLCNIAVIFIP